MTGASGRALDSRAEMDGARRGWTTGAGAAVAEGVDAVIPVCPAGDVASPPGAADSVLGSTGWARGGVVVLSGVMVAEGALEEGGVVVSVTGSVEAEVGAATPPAVAAGMAVAAFDAGAGGDAASVEGSTGSARNGAFVSSGVEEAAGAATGAAAGTAVTAEDASTGNATGGELLSAGRARRAVSLSGTAGSELVVVLATVAGSACAK